jgi:hypothetical protein
MFEHGRTAEALALVAALQDAEVAASAVSAAVISLYRSQRDVANMVLAALSGSAWCLGQASLQSDAEVATRLKGRARAITFNAAANCWPGWDDEGVTIEDWHIAAGLSLAGLCLMLSRDLGLGAKAEGTAQWLVGALELALGDVASARATFAEAEQSNAALGDEAPQRLMAQGYHALADKCAAPDSHECARALQQALERLRAAGPEHGQFFADQIETAQRVFERRRGAEE